MLIIFERKIDGDEFFKEISNYDINEWIKKQKFDLNSCEQKKLNDLTIINKTLLMIRRKSLFFGKKDSMNEGIMKPTKKFSNNFSQNLVLNGQNLEKQFLSKPRIDNSLQNDLSSKFD